MSKMTPQAIKAAARAEAPHLWNGAFEASLLAIAGPYAFTPEEAAESAEQKRQEHLARAERCLTAASPIIQAEALRNHKALTQAAVDMAAVSGSPAHHVIAAIFAVSKLQDQAKAEALRDAAEVLDQLDRAGFGSPEIDGYADIQAVASGGTIDWLRARAATIEGEDS